MADDDKGGKPATPVPAGHALGSQGEKAENKATNDRAPLTEWTASDRRGPLGSAGEEDVERFVPAHEMDAEGGIDPAIPAVHGTTAHEASSHDPAFHERTTAHDPAINASSDHEPPHHEPAHHEPSEDELTDHEAGGNAPWAFESTHHDGDAHALDSPDQATHDPGHEAPTMSPAHVPAGTERHDAMSAAPERRRSLVPVAAGVIVGALIGAGSAWLVYTQSGPATADETQVAALSSRVDALDKRPDPQAALAKLQTEYDGLQAKVASLVSSAASSQPAGPANSASQANPARAANSAGETGSAKTTDVASAGASAKPAGAAGQAPGPAPMQAASESAKPSTPSATASRGEAKSSDGGGDKTADDKTAGDETASHKTAPPAMEAPAAAPVADPGLAAKVAALQAALDDVKSRTASLQAQDAKESGAAAEVTTLRTGVDDAQKQAAGAQSSLDAVKSEQKQLGDKLAGLTIAVAGALKTADGAQKQAAGAQSGLDSVQTKQKVLEGKLGSPALAVVADSLVQQIDAGQPFTRQVDALAALNADPAKIAVLRENAAHGVPSAQALLGQWRPLADPVIATGNTAPANANFGQRLEHGLFGLVSVRRADGTTGTDLASRVNLIEADLAHGDVAGAYATWQALPADAKAKSQSWGTLAKTSVEASAAGRELQQSAIDALGAKKS